MGRQQFSQPIYVTAQTAQSVQFIKVQSSTPIPVGGNETIYIYAPASTVAELNAINVVVPAVTGAISGFKTSYLRQIGTETISITRSTGDWNKDTSFDNSVWLNSTSAAPVDASALVNALRNLSFSPVTALALRVENNTDAIFNDTRFLRVFAKLTVVVN